MTAAPTVAAAVRGGVVAFAFRLGVLQVFRLLSAVILARLLFPEDYAVFGALATLVAFLQFGVDLGLGGSLVQQPAPPTPDEYATGFALQQAIGWALVVAAWAVADPLSAALDLPANAAWMLRVFALTLPLTAARVIPTARLNRELRFRTFVRPEIVETASLYTVQIGLAALGGRAWALVLGGVTRAIVGLAALSRQVPWSVRLAWNPGWVRRALRFGIPFQVTAALAGLRAFIPAWVVLLIAGTTESGLVLWSLGLVGVLWQLAFLVDRVLFPAFARLVDEPAAAARGAGSLLLAGALGGVAVAAMGAPLVPWAIPVIFGERWVGAIPVLPPLLWGTALAVTSYLTASILNGLGRPGARLATVGLGMLVELGLTAAWVPGSGAVGYAYAALAAAAAEVLLALVLVRRHVPIALTPLAVVGLGAVGALGAAHWLRHPAVAALAAGAALAAAVLLGARPHLARLTRHVLGAREGRAA